MTTDISQFPIDLWSKYVKEAFHLFKHEMSEIPVYKGPLELRKSIAQLISYKEVSFVILNKSLSAQVQQTY